MTKPTKTRATLRQMIGIELGMPFYRLYGPQHNHFTTGTTINPVDTALVQAADYWNNSWLLVNSTGAANGDVRQILDFLSTGDALVLDRAIGQTPSSSIGYEILTVFSPHEVHQAINLAIEAAFPAFYEIVNDQSLVICHDKLAYDVSGFSTKIWSPVKLWAERNLESKIGIADSGGNTSLTDANIDLTGVVAGWNISIYEGTGAGQLRSVSSVAGQQINVSIAWTTNPDDTSKYRLWDSNFPGVDWYELPAVRFDQKEYPSLVLFPHHLNALEGFRLRIQYTAQPPALWTDDATTIVPAEFILHKAIAILAASRTNDNRADRGRYQSLLQLHTEMAEMYKVQNAWRHPTTRIWLEEDPAMSSYPGVDSANPLGW